MEELRYSQMSVSCSTYLGSITSTLVPLLDEVLLGDNPCAEVADSVHRHYTNVLNGSEQVLEGDEVAPNTRAIS